MRAHLVTLLILAVGCGSESGEEVDDVGAGGTRASAGESARAGTGGVLSTGGALSPGGMSASGHGGGGSGASNAGAGGSAGLGGAAGNGAGGAVGGAGGGAGGAGGAGGTAGSGGLGGRGGMATGGAGGGSGGSGVVFPPNCTCLGLGPPACTPTGDITFTLSKSASPTADEQSAYEAITCAMTGAVAYYNCNTTISKKLSVTYVPTVATADSNFNGSIRFGADHGYMVCATSMHEVAHSLGVGTAPNWSKVSSGGLFNGATATAQLRAITGKADDAVHSDTQHFWPYGLNYASEAKSTADLIDHCLMVTAIRKDLGL